MPATGEKQPTNMADTHIAWCYNWLSSHPNNTAAILHCS